MLSCLRTKSRRLSISSGFRVFGLGVVFTADKAKSTKGYAQHGQSRSCVRHVIAATMGEGCSGCSRCSCLGLTHGETIRERSSREVSRYLKLGSCLVKFRDFLPSAEDLNLARANPKAARDRLRRATVDPASGTEKGLLRRGRFVPALFNNRHLVFLVFIVLSRLFCPYFLRLRTYQAFLYLVVLFWSCLAWVAQASPIETSAQREYFVLLSSFRGLR